MRFYLDGIDVTAQMAKQAVVSDTDGGVYPDEGTKWFDMLALVNQNSFLKEKFFSSGGLHVFKIVNDAGYQFDAKIILRMNYTARSC